MKKRSLLGTILLSGIIMTGCGSSKTALEVNALNGDWNIATVNGQQATADKQPYLKLNLQDKEIYGCAGCNRINGQIEVNENETGKISFGQIGSTRMLCNNMATETAILEALNKVKGYEGTEIEVILTDAKGNALLTLVKRPEISLESLKGKWNITHVYGISIDELGEVENKPFLEFDTDKKTVHGNAGCNIINGVTEQTEGAKTSLKFNQMISTMKSGIGMAVESKIMEAINQVSGFTFENEKRIILNDANGNNALTLVK